jgi:trehalose/maltose hydrolase-like predicted phosphorylase
MAFTSSGKEHYTAQFPDYQPQYEGQRESLLTLGNGYIATRGAVEFSSADNIHYPGTYLAGGYNRLESLVQNQLIVNEDFVNWPNWLLLTFRINNGHWFSIDSVKIIDFNRTIDFLEGTLTTSIEFVDEVGNQSKLLTKRLVSMSNIHLAAIRWYFTPVNWFGSMTVRSAIDGSVTNNLVKRYRSLNGNHLLCERTGQSGEKVIYLECRTRQSRIQMAQAVQIEIEEQNLVTPIFRETHIHKEYIDQCVTIHCQKNHEIIITKTAAIYTSRDKGISEPLTDACAYFEHSASFDALLQEHIIAWKHIWARGDIDFEGVDNLMSIVRLNIFHLFQTASLHTHDFDVGIPPRGLHGEAYRGHILWDELFIFPFLNYRIPVLTRQFLLYRYRRLNTARIAAVTHGYRGAMYPWQSASSGREESQMIHLNPDSNRWVPDNTWLQRHVNSAIAFNIYQYYQVTDDKDFLYWFGAEMFFEIARFWSSMCIFSQSKGRFEIHNVVGPDEYHTQYPGSSQKGINNNAYTNIMVIWVLSRALELLTVIEKSRMDELREKLDLDDEEIERWRTICNSMYVPFLSNGMISQFEGYDQLKELDWEYYRKKHGDNMRLDRILEKEGDSIDNYKAGKQADVLMLFYLFSADELKDLLNKSGYEFDTQDIPRTIVYYRDRVSHGSTLSRIVLSWVLARSDRKRSWNELHDAIYSDYNDIQGGTTAEGIHLAAMAGTLDLLQRCYTGLEARGNVLHVNPLLPENINKLSLRIRYRSHWLNFEITHECMSIAFEEGWGNPILIGFDGEYYSLKHQQSRTFTLKQ